MNKSNMQEFFDLWDDIAELFGKPVSNTAKKIVFNSLARFEMVDVRGALEAHMTDSERGRFMPKPADIIAQIERVKPSSWLGSDEAWALFPRDESQSGCVYQEMQTAFGISCECGDEISARMAFRDAYNRLVAQAKAQRLEPKWIMSIGRDKRQAEESTLQAVEQGRISASYAAGLLPHLPEEEILKLERREVSPQKLLMLSEQKQIGLGEVAALAGQRSPDEVSKKHLSEINAMLGINREDVA